jgi:rSAM/selenodomain-associated transferase 2
MSPRFSIIIPALNESSLIENALFSLPRRADAERIVVDGGSSDDTAALARPLADKVLVAPAGRARQMNAGARAAAGEVFLFLHADSRLPADALDSIAKALEIPIVAGGAFDLAIDSPRWALRLVAWAANRRTRITGVPYGDQGIFVRRSVFESLGGFPEWPLLEDLEFSRRIKAAGTVVILPQPITVSARRWDKEGIGYSTLRNQIFVLLYFLGVSPSRLARWYCPIR